MEMEKEKKTDLKKVVKKSRDKKADKNSVSAFEVHTVKPIVESKVERKKPKEQIENGKKSTGKKGQGKQDTGDYKTHEGGVKKETEKTKDKSNPGKEPGAGEKAGVSGAPAKRRERASLNEILTRILPPWF